MPIKVRIPLKAIICNGLLSIFTIASLLFILELMLRADIIKNDFRGQSISTGETINPKYKILILGDSFGKSLKDNLSAALAPYKVKLLNTSIPGMGPFEYLTEMKTWAVRFKPDITLLFYYAGNDLSNVQYNRQNRSDLKSRVFSFLRSAFHDLYIYRFYQKKVESLMPRAFDYEKFRKTGIGPEMIELVKNNKVNPWLLEASYVNKNYLVDNILIESEGNIKAWEKVKALLKEVKKTADKVNSEFVIVIIPATVQVNKSKYAFYESLKLNVDERMLLSDRPQALLKDFCGEQDIMCLDLLPYFKAAKVRELYLENDDHLNEAGRGFAAKLTVDFLLEKTRLNEK